MPKIYTPETWQDEALVGNPRYDIKEDDGTAFKALMQLVLANAVTQAGTNVTAAVMQNIEDAIDALDTLLRAAPTEKTVSGGVLTVDQSRHGIQPQSGTADDIDTISGMEADVLHKFYASDAGVDTLTFKHGTGNVSCFGAADIDLSEGIVLAIKFGTTVYVAGGGGGTPEVTLANTVTLTNKRITKRIVTVTQAAEPAINTNNGDIFNITGLAQAITSLTTNLTGTPTEGQMFMLCITDNATARAITPGASFLGTLNFTLTGLTTTISKKLMLLWKYNGSVWELVGQEQSL